MRASTRAGRAGLVVALTMLAGCDSSDGDDDRSREVDVLVVAIREVLGSDPAPLSDGELPVVYVVSGTGDGLPATVQADVANEVQDEVVVRFADERSEAVKSGEPDAPVPDSGVLLVVGDIGDDEATVDVPIEIYRTERDTTSFVFTFSESEAGWAVTATSVVARAS